MGVTNFTISCLLTPQMLHTKFDIDLPSSSEEELLTDDGQCVTHNDERQPIAIGNPRDSGDIEITT